MLPLNLIECSPRTWRSSERGADPLTGLYVLSTHVEVFRDVDGHSWVAVRALHARGGLPAYSQIR